MHMNCELRSIRSIYLFKLFQAQGSHYTVAVDGEGTYSERKEKERERERESPMQIVLRAHPWFCG